ncbi:hypothetical protein [Variovorax sp. CY25R-8]|uniref:hypothetical protein n=1 Tax=Variovorax sp. CY25R-8 TaxID=2855501 RepID=UPI0021BB30F4|nr:hypothetical protein [Variovorax sp. CY25R-8]MCT8176721.1 hypothetical protein [Variovorax sp. CY25R-8]
MIYKHLVKIPILGSLLAITNAYVFNGDFASDRKFAPLLMWAKLLPCIIFSIGLTVLTIFAPCIAIDNKFPQCGLGKDSFVSSGGALSTAILPTILGFGIGVYALIFSLSKKFVRLFHEKSRMAQKDGRKISVLTINADIAYPLISIVFSILIGLIQQRFPTMLWLSALAWMSLWYSMLMTLEIIGTIYRLGEHSLLDKVDEDDDHSWS